MRVRAARAAKLSAVRRRNGIEMGMQGFLWKGVAE
jgi:hypothetical protein